MSIWFSVFCVCVCVCVCVLASCTRPSILSGIVICKAMIIVAEDVISQLIHPHSHRGLILYKILSGTSRPEAHWLLQWMAMTPLPLFLASTDTERTVQQSIELLWTRQDATNLAWPRMKLGCSDYEQQRPAGECIRSGPRVLSLYSTTVWWEKQAM
jgi:hypothetical protein